MTDNSAHSTMGTGEHKGNGNGPLVTIVIPAYNHERFVADSVKSVLSQVYKNWELIIIDDGSTDRTGKIVDGFSGHDRIKIIHQENQGLSPTLNQGLEMAQGEYFGFLPSDDMFYPEKLLLQVDFLQKHTELAGVGSLQALIDAEGKPIHDTHMEHWFSYEPQSRADFLLKLLERNFVPAPSMLLRTDIVRSSGGFAENITYMQDYDLWFRILKNHDMKIMPRQLIYYRWHGGNQTYKATEETEAERGLVFERAAKLIDIPDLYPSMWDGWRPELIALARADLFQHLSVNPTPNFEEIRGIFDEKFTQIWRQRKQLDIPAPLLEKVSPCILNSDQPPAVMIEVNSLDSGGLEQVVHDLALSLADIGTPVTVTCVEKGGLTADRLMKKGIRVEILPPNGKADAYRNIIRDAGIRLVNAHYSAFGASICLEQAIPFVSTIHNIYSWLPAGITEGIRETDPLVSHYIAVSTDARDYLVSRFNIKAEKITVIPNGLDVAGWQKKQQSARDMRKEAGLSSRDYIYLCIASISRVKGQDRIVRAMPEVLKQCPQAKAILVGEKVDEAFCAYLDNLIHDRGLDQNVIIREFDPDPASWYFSANAFVLPSVIEGWSISMMEAMFAGLPLIMTDLAGARMVMARQKLGILLPRPFGMVPELGGNFMERYCMMDADPMITDLASAMLAFCSDPEKWQKAGITGRKLVQEQFNVQRQAKACKDLFNRVMMNFSSRFVEFYNQRFQDLNRALESSQRTIEKLYEQQRQGYWLNEIHRELEKALDDKLALTEALEQEKRARQQERQALDSKLADALNQVRQLQQELNTIYNSKSWKLISSYRKLRETSLNRNK